MHTSGDQQQQQYLVDPAERGHVHSLPPDGTGAPDTGRVLTGTAVDDGVDQHLQGVLERREGGGVQIRGELLYYRLRMVSHQHGLQMDTRYS